MRTSLMRPQFVELIPEQLKTGVLYVSMEYGAVVHLCACGCGEKSITPLKPTDWRLIFDGEAITLRPSVGNWSFACRSHYCIIENKVHWAEEWSHSRVKANRMRQGRDKQRYFDEADRGLGRDDQGKRPSLLSRLRAKVGL
jgi:hypothetical protein